MTSIETIESEGARESERHTDTHGQVGTRGCGYEANKQMRESESLCSSHYLRCCCVQSDRNSLTHNNNHLVLQLIYVRGIIVLAMCTVALSLYERL